MKYCSYIHLYHLFICDGDQLVPWKISMRSASFILRGGFLVWDTFFRRPNLLSSWWNYTILIHVFFFVGDQLLYIEVHVHTRFGRRCNRRTAIFLNQNRWTQESWKNFIMTKDSSLLLGNRVSLLVRAPDSWSKGCEFESRQERRKNFLLQGQLFVLTLIRCPFHPRVTAVARKRPRSFCKKCRWQVTPKHAYTLD